MTIKIEAFLALEASLSDRLSKSYTKATKPLFQVIESLMAAGQFVRARAAVQHLSLDDVFVGHERYIEYLSHLSMLFGASRVTRRPGTTLVGLGFEKDIVFQAIQTFKQSLTVRGRVFLIQSALQSIALQELRHLESVSKAEKPRRILQPFASFMNDAGKSQFNIASSLHTSRLSAYGFTAEADVMGYTTYQITEQLDSRTCEVCRIMHGKTFKITDARNLLSVALRTKDPADLKQIQPWPSQSKAGIAELSDMSPSELVSNGWHVPPFHPRCRGLLARSGHVPPLGKPESPKELPKPPYAPSLDEFKALGVSISEDNLSQWANNVPIPPAELMARLKGLGLPEYLSKLPLDASLTKTKAAAGIKSLTFNDDHIALRMYTEMYGSKENAAMVIKMMYEEQALNLSILDLAGVDQASGVAKQVLKNLVGIASDLEYEKLTLTAGLDIGGYAWAKFGFAPTPEDWLTLRGRILSAPSTAPVLEKATGLQVQAFKAIMASDDPLNIFALADLPTIGKKILAGTTWEGALDFSSSEAMTRFLTYIGKGA